jgi:hypothetical protein
LASRSAGACSSAAPRRPCAASTYAGLAPAGRVQAMRASMLGARELHPNGAHSLGRSRSSLRHRRACSRIGLPQGRQAGTSGRKADGRLLDGVHRRASHHAPHPRDPHRAGRSSTHPLARIGQRSCAAEKRSSPARATCAAARKGGRGLPGCCERKCAHHQEPWGPGSTPMLRNVESAGLSPPSLLYRTSSVPWLPMTADFDSARIVGIEPTTLAPPRGRAVERPVSSRDRLDARAGIEPAPRELPGPSSTGGNARNDAGALLRATGRRVGQHDHWRSAGDSNPAAPMAGWQLCSALAPCVPRESAPRHRPSLEAAMLPHPAVSTSTGRVGTAQYDARGCSTGCWLALPVRARPLPQGRTCDSLPKWAGHGVLMPGR